MLSGATNRIASHRLRSLGGPAGEKPTRQKQHGGRQGQRLTYKNTTVSHSTQAGDRACHSAQQIGTIRIKFADDVPFASRPVLFPPGENEAIGRRWRHGSHGRRTHEGYAGLSRLTLVTKLNISIQLSNRQPLLPFVNN